MRASVCLYRSLFAAPISEASLKKGFHNNQKMFSPALKSWHNIALQALPFIFSRAIASFAAMTVLARKRRVLNCSATRDYMLVVYP
jgi:hypothetical protein